MALHRKVDVSGEPDVDINPIYVQEAGHEVPRHTMPRRGMLPATALQVVRDELILDGNPRLNLATFVTTWMEPQAEVLMAECLGKNMIDKDEYPQTAELESRCVSILADLWHAQGGSEATGCSTTGSSEACMLGGMALLWRWRERGGTGRPNLVMGANVQVCWEKFCRYWRVEPRRVPLEPGRLHLTGPEAVARCDQNTIGVVAIMGSTFDGSYEPVAGIGSELDSLAAGGGPDLSIHVDAASGGFFAPFLHPDLAWDFRVPRVASINASGHKYGLVYPGVGWVVWRDSQALPEDLVFKVNYLGGQMPTFALNFSRSGAPSRPSTTTSCGWASTATGGSSRHARTSRCTCRPGSPGWGRSSFSPTAAICPSSPSSWPVTRPATACSTCPNGCARAAGWCPPTPSRRT